MNTTVYVGRTNKVVLIHDIPPSATDSDIVDTALLAANETTMSHFGLSTHRDRKDRSARVTIWTD